MANQYLKYWLVTAAAIVVCVVLIFWRPSVTYTAAIYREPNYVQEPYLIQASTGCGSLWMAATGGLHTGVAPQYPPPASESAAQYLALLSTYKNDLTSHSLCDTRRQNLGLIFGASVGVAVVSEVLRRRKVAADARVEPMEVPSLEPH